MKIMALYQGYDKNKHIDEKFNKKKYQKGMRLLIVYIVSNYF